MLMEAVEGALEEGQPAPLQIYDVPYEGGGDGDRTAAVVVTRGPELDPRPSTEYELPWEWKKEHIVRTLSGMSRVCYVRIEDKLYIQFLGILYSYLQIRPCFYTALDQYEVHLFKKQLRPALTFIFHTLHRPTAY